MKTVVNATIPQRLVDAAQSGDVTLVQQLLDEGVYEKPTYSRALMSAAAWGHRECVRVLVSVCYTNVDDSCALRMAAAYGHTECVRLLLPISDPKSHNSEALWAAAYEGHVDVVDVLFDVCDHKVALERLLTDLEIHSLNPQYFPGIVYLQQKIQAKKDNIALQEHVDASSVLCLQNTRRQL